MWLIDFLLRASVAGERVMMRKKIRNSIALLVLLAMVVTLVAPTGVMAAGTSTSDLGALLDSYTANDETYTISASSRLFVISDTEPSGDLLQTVQLAQRQFAADGYELDIVWGPESRAKDGDIVVNLIAAFKTEAYQLDVTTTAKVTAGDVNGLLYGLNMLQKHIRAGGASIQGFTAQDAPDTAERTVQLDCARKYFTKDWVCNFIKQMSWMGYNTLQLHFSEDGGFRADFWDETYYQKTDTDGDGYTYSPANDFSWICGSHVQSWVGSGYANDPDAGKYLTTSEIIEILEVAKEYHIDVIPSFDSPSHMDYLCWQFEQNYKSNTSYSFTYNGTTYKASATKGCINYCGYTGGTYPEWCEYTTIDINDDTTRGKMAQAFIFQLYTDIADFFKEYAGSTKFAIGADEVNLTASSDISWSYSQFPGYINELNTLLNNKGYTMRMFNDFIKADYLDQFADNIEILYWNSPFGPNSGTTTESSILTVQKLVNDGRTLYNCIQTSTYYVLRVADGVSSSNSNYMKDARDPSNTNWTFYHSDEDSIYDEWYPADISEHGNYSENVADVPSDQLGGGYFLLWNDYAAVSTESEVWNGVDSSGTWNVIDRMWSNTIKMWNWDINDDVAYTAYAKIREKFGEFPGYTSCSKAASLPAATAPTQASLADHTALTTALSKVITDGSAYTEETWAAYEAAVTAAKAVNADYDATAEALAAQVKALEEATDALRLDGVLTLTVEFMTTVNGSETKIKTGKYEVDPNEPSYELYLAPMTGYEFEKAVGTTYTPLASGDGSGFIKGRITKDTTVEVWYENAPDATRLNYLLTNDEDNLGYTEASWTAYQTALNNATADNVDISSQDRIDELVAAIEAAQTALVMKVDETEILSVEKLTETARQGKLVGLRITTTADVAALTVTSGTEDESVMETLSLYTGKVQTLSSGKTVKIWLIGFPAEELGDFTYTVTGAGTEAVSTTVEVTVR